MSYKTIALCLSSIQAVPDLIEVAKELGTAFGAHIQALYVIPAATVYSGAEFGGTVQFYDEVRRCGLFSIGYVLASLQGMDNTRKGERFEAAEQR